MMMNDAKKKAVSIIVSKPESSSQEEVTGYEAAAEDILLALKEQSPKRLKEALKAFVDMCMYEQEESEDKMEG
jgi:hypothetical protein